MTTERQDTETGNGEKGKKKHTRMLHACMAILAIMLLLLAGFYLLRSRGRAQLERDMVGSASGMQRKRHHTSELDLELDMTSRAGVVSDMGTDAEMACAGATEHAQAKEGRVFYQGRAYDYNQDIMTFLVMGIDQRSETVQEQTQGYDGGSADAIFLVVLNPHIKKVKIIAIDRNTMTDVDIYDYYGTYLETVQTQICVQHGYGDGTVKSAQYMEKAVSNFMYGLPIHGYCAINMSAIEKINDAVGGVDVVVLDDLTKWDWRLEKGKTVHLNGRRAFVYLQRRDTGIFGSAEGRLERQKQYLEAFLAKAKAQFKEDPTLPVTMFQELGPYMTTDLNLEKVIYLADLAAGFDFAGADITKIAGENVMGERYEEFYVDETAMYELILDTFYEEVN